MTSEQIRIEYVPIDQVIRWEHNPKRHDIGAIAESIRRFGFRDPPAYDGTLGALVHGNGRTETLVWMRDEGQEPPRGIALDDRGRWCMPVVFGNDAASTTEAVAYAIAHNNLTMAGGDYTALDMARMWDDTYLPILRDLAEAEALPPTMDEEALGTLILAAAPEVPEPDAQQEPELRAECFIEVYCSQDDLVEFQPTLDEWSNRRGVTINIS